jgi:hypothetical protein
MYIHIGAVQRGVGGARGTCEHAAQLRKTASLRPCRLQG